MNKQTRNQIRAFIEEFPSSERKKMRKRYLNEQTVELNVVIDGIFALVDNVKQHCDWLADVTIELYELEQKMRLRDRYKRELNMIMANKPYNHITDYDIELARQIDVASLDLIDGQFPSSGGRYMAPCLWHKEKHPSLVMYPNGGFFCFGCQKYGNAIDVVMETMELDFIKAIKYLLNI